MCGGCGGEWGGRGRGREPEAEIGSERDQWQGDEMCLEILTQDNLNWIILIEKSWRGMEFKKI